MATDSRKREYLKRKIKELQFNLIEKNKENKNLTNACKDYREMIRLRDKEIEELKTDLAICEDSLKRNVKEA